MAVNPIMLTGILCLLASSLDLLRAQAVSSMGTLFITSTPKLPARTGKLMFLMATWSEERFKVSIGATLYVVDKPLNDTVSLSKSKPVDYHVLSKYISTELYGRAWCYTLQGQYSFSLTVLMEVPGTTIESFQAVPVAGWGKRYVIFTLQECPSIQLITEVNQSLWMVNHYGMDRRPVVSQFSFGRKEAFSMTYLKSSPTYYHMSGVIFVGHHPFGLVSGSCLDFTRRRDCTLKDPRRVLFTEMLLGNKSLGTDFVGLYIPLIDELAEFYIMAIDTFTHVNISTHSSHQVVTLFKAEMHMYHRGKNSEPAGFRIQSTKPVQVVLLQLTPCLETVDQSVDKGDSSLSLIIPNSLFYVRYIWMTPHTNTTDYTIVVIRSDELSHLELNHVRVVTNITVYNVPGDGDYQIINLMVPKGVNTLTTKPVARFGCYLFGKGAGESYMHPVGFYECLTTVVAIDDEIDNDCDGRIDEELEDKKDNDGDKKIDEDTRTLRVVNGSWGPWDAWGCNPAKQKYRKRLCNAPAPSDGGKDCDGSNIKTSNSTCQPKNGQWGAWLGWSCVDKSVHEIRQRMRNCDSPAPEDGGFHCPGENTEDDVNTTCVPVNGAWNMWSEWTCDPLISTVVIFRRRLCDSPAPFNGGDYCGGRDNETKTAVCVPIDGQWGLWTNWTCVDNKFHFKTRLCDNPSPKDRGLPCPGRQNLTKSPCYPPAGSIFDGLMLTAPLLLIVPLGILSYIICHDRKVRKQTLMMEEQLNDEAAEADEKASTSTATRKTKSRSLQSSPKSSHSRTNVGATSRTTGGTSTAYTLRVF